MYMYACDVQCIMAKEFHLGRPQISEVTIYDNPMELQLQRRMADKHVRVIYFTCIQVSTRTQLSQDMIYAYQHLSSGVARLFLCVCMKDKEPPRRVCKPFTQGLEKQQPPSLQKRPPWHIYPIL